MFLLRLTEQWKIYENDIIREGLEFSVINSDIVDQIWTEDRPPQPNTDLSIHPLEYAGL